MKKLTTLRPMPASQLLGAARLAIDATEGLTDIVENMHRTIQLRPAPLGTAGAGHTRGITGFVYRRIRQTVRLVGTAIDAGAAATQEPLPDADSPQKHAALRAIVNGVCGDYLARSANPLAITMQLRHRGLRIDNYGDDSVRIVRENGEPARRILVMVHGLCMTDSQWHRNGHNHGEALAREPESDLETVYLRYNSGLSIAANGRAFAELLESVAGNSKGAVSEVTIIGHSMGGLVARSAAHYAQQLQHGWLSKLNKMFFLGAPHHGAPLERGGHGLDILLGLSPYSAPLKRVGLMRSAGITDLRHGTITAAHEPVPLPAHVQCFAIAASRAADNDSVAQRLIGDGLVPLDSALGIHRNAACSLGIPDNQQWVGRGLGHLDLLSDEGVFRQLALWL